MRTALAVTYLVAFIISLLFFFVGNSIGSGMFCGGRCLFEQTGWMILQEVALVTLFIGSIAGFSSRKGTSFIKDLLLAIAVIPLAGVAWVIFMFMSVVFLGQNSPFF